MKLPKSWAEVTVEVWYKLRAIKAENNIDELVETLAILSGKSKEEIENIPIDELSVHMKSMAFLNKLPDGKIPKLVWANGRFYSINVNLNTITPAQYIDHSTLTKDQATIENNIHKIMAVFCLPLKKWSFTKTVPYHKDPHDKRSEAFLKLPMSVVYPVAVFFCSLSDNFMPVTRDYLKQVENQMKPLVS